MGVATTYNPGDSGAPESAATSMLRFIAPLFLAFVCFASAAFSAEPPAGTTFSGDPIDPKTGLAPTTEVRPLTGAPPVPAAGRPITARTDHIALILPTSSPALGRLADAVRQGFIAASEAAGADAIPVRATAIEHEGQPLLDACRLALSTGALVVVGGLTRDGAMNLANSDCSRQPVLTLNEARAEGARRVYSVSLSLEQEARQAALLAVENGLRSAIVIHTNAPISRRVADAFEREWTRAAGEIRRIPYSGRPDDAPLLKERLAPIVADMVFLALDSDEALAVRPYVSAMLPAYATSLSINPRAEPLVNLDLQGVRYVEMPWFIQPDHPAVMAYPSARGAANVEQERLYALGIDAYRLAIVLARGEAGKEPLDGVTGRITLEEGNAFARHLSPAEVDGGRVVPLRQ